MVLEVGHDPDSAIRQAKKLAPSPAGVHVLAFLPTPTVFWRLDASWQHNEQSVAQSEAWFASLEEAFGTWGPVVGTELVFELSAGAIEAEATSAGADLVVLGAFGAQATRSAVPLIEETARVCGVPVLWAGAPAGVVDAGPVRRVLCPFEAPRDLRPVAAFLREHGIAEPTVVAVCLGTPDAESRARAASVLEVGGAPGPITVEGVDVPLWERAAALRRIAAAHGTELLVFGLDAVSGVSALALRVAGGRLLEREHPSMLVLPPLGDASAPAPPIDAPDVLLSRLAPPRLLVERPALVGASTPVTDGELGVVVRGRLVARLPLVDGVAEIAPGLLPEPPGRLGLGLSGATSSEVGTELVQATVSVLRPGRERVTLVDAALPDAALARAAVLVGELGGERLVLAVRLGPGPQFEATRRRLGALGYDRPLVVDAGLLLGEGLPSDLPGGVEALRLTRVAAWLRGCGVAVDSVVTVGAREVSTRGFAQVRAQELADLTPDGLQQRMDEAYLPPASWERPALDGMLDEVTGSRRIGGCHVRLELDNTEARRGLVRWIDGARERVHLQVYIVEDDPVAAEVEAALAAASERGVTVRLLADSLYSRHGSFGATNPLLERLEARGVQVRTWRPVTSFPSLDDLKQRDHRKLVIVDGARAVVTGRNLGASYYRGFHEVAITGDSPCDAIPWVDAGAELEGPAVRAVDEAFLRAWEATGGEPFDLRTPPRAGGSDVRVVVHEGMRDTRTLDTYLLLVREARESVTVVNTFPLHLGLQRALVDAVRRGVRVRALFGNVRPVHGDRIPFQGGAIRDLATQVVHGRMDALVAAGAEAYEMALPPMSGWDPALEPTRPHIHAKILSSDGRLCTIGSANVDVTAGYWESECVLVIEDPVVVGSLDAALAEIMARSIRVDREDPRWQAAAERRAWLSRYWPGVLD